MSSSGEGDRINNGALDNAMGTSMLLEVARLLAVEGARPRRSVLLIAHTRGGGNARGLRAGTRPTGAEERIVASINLDMPVLLHDFPDVIAFGGSHSMMERAIAMAASSMKVALSPDPMPDEGGSRG